MENFKFNYTKPCLDYYEIVEIEIKPNEFDLLIIERRYGPCWWLLGYKYNKTLEKWDENQIAEIYNNDIARLIQWCKKNSLVINARPLEGNLDIIKPCYEIYKRYLELNKREGVEDE